MAKGPFKLKSGNQPTFKNMGGSPVSLKNFGVGPGDSPYKDEYTDAKKKDPKLDEYIAIQKQHKPGSEEYEANQAKINAAYGKERDQGLKTAQISSENGNEDDTSVETEIAETTDTVDDTDNGDKGGKGQGWKAAAGLVGSMLTSGLDAVYGSGKVVSGSERLKKKDKKEECPLGYKRNAAGNCVKIGE